MIKYCKNHYIYWKSDYYESSFSIGIQAGYGVTISNIQFKPAPYVGVGLSYSLISWWKYNPHAFRRGDYILPPLGNLPPFQVVISTAHLCIIPKDLRDAIYYLGTIAGDCWNSSKCYGGSA